jgi:hypothetical protein
MLGFITDQTSRVHWAGDAFGVLDFFGILLTFPLFKIPLSSFLASVAMPESIANPRTNCLRFMFPIDAIDDVMNNCMMSLLKLRTKQVEISCCPKSLA